MGKSTKVVICGKKGVGKTAIMEQAIYGKLTKDTFLQSTIEDIYVASVETERGVKEKIRVYDTGSDFVSNVNLHYADGYILVFNPSKMDSLDYIMTLKKDIDKNKERKEVLSIILANYCSPSDQLVISKAQSWVAREKIKMFNVSALERSSLYEPFIFLASRLNQQVAKSSFGQLGVIRKH